jgi:hypothetical protein
MFNKLHDTMKYTSDTVAMPGCEFRGEAATSDLRFELPAPQLGLASARIH